MTDKEIINGLIVKDNQITTEFFFVKCRPLFYSIIRHVFRMTLIMMSLSTNCINILWTIMLQNCMDFNIVVH